MACWLRMLPLSLLGSVAWADGCFVAPVMPERVAGTAGVAATEQKGIVIELPQGREALLLQTTYHGPAERFAWVIPVPGKPGKDDVFLASPDFVDALLDNTRPEVKTTITDPRERRGGYAGRKMAEQKAMPAEGGAPGGLPPTVTVHERMAVGDFDVAVLSATGTEVLTGWLIENGFQIPEAAEGIFRSYVERAWYFVALRMKPAKAAERPILEDVSPIGIRFPTPRLVYPLYISRASSRDKTALLLVVLSNGPLKCDQLIDVRLPLGRWFPKGSSYAAIRRAALAAFPTGALCEYRGPEGFPYIDLHYRKDSWGGEEGPAWTPGSLWTTRWWALLGRESMEDLTFSAVDDRRTVRLAVTREGTIHRPFLERVTLTTGGVSFLLAVAAGAAFILSSWALSRGIATPSGCLAGTVVGTLLLSVVISIGSLIFGPILVALVLVIALTVVMMAATHLKAREGLPPARVDWVAWLKGALVAAGLAVYGFLLWRLCTEGTRFLWNDSLGQGLREAWRGDRSSLAALVVPALQIGWLVLVAELLWRGLRGAKRRALWLAAPFLGLLGLLALLLSAGDTLGDIHDAVSRAHRWHRSAEGLLSLLQTTLAPVTVAGVLLVLSYAIVGAFIAPSGRQTAQPLAHAILAAVLVSGVAMIVPSLANAGGFGIVPSGTAELDGALQSIDDMLVRFVAANGSYPARLGDMVGARVPTEGVDSSGNPVPIARQPRADMAPPLDGPLGPGAPVSELPVDILTGRSRTWTYEPTGSPMVDSGGYRIRIDLEGNQPPERVSRWQPGRPLDESYDSVRRRFYWGGAESQAFPAPSGERVVRFSNGEHGAVMYVGSPDGTQSKLLTAKPWPVYVRRVAWDPTREEWLVIAGPLKGDSRAGLYHLGRDRLPRLLSSAGDFVAAEYAPDGRAILALVDDTPPEREAAEAVRAAFGRPPPPRRPPPTEAALWRLSLDGSKEKLLAQAVAVEPFIASNHGSLAVIAGEEQDSLVFTDQSGRSRRLSLPVKWALVVDLWVGAREVCVALRKRYPRPGSADDLAPVGQVWSYALDTARWRHVAGWQSTISRVSDRPGGIEIRGRDPATGGLTLHCTEQGAEGTYLVRDREPRLELLPDEAAKLPATISVDVAGQKESVMLEGYYWAKAFQPGDLIADQPGPGTPINALAVAARRRGRLILGERAITLPTGDIPIIGQSGKECYAKMRWK